MSLNINGYLSVMNILREGERASPCESKPNKWKLNIQITAFYAGDVCVVREFVCCRLRAAALEHGSETD